MQISGFAGLQVVTLRSEVNRDHNFVIYKRTLVLLLRRGATVAKPIELCLVLDREEAVRFQKYIDNPTYTEEGRKLIREAADLAERSRY